MTVKFDPILNKIRESDSVAVATGAEVNTGTDDTKIVSAKALADSTYIKPLATAITGTGGTTVLTAAQNKCTSLELSGALTSDWYIVIADTKAPFSVENLCTNTATYRVFIKTAAGTETPYVSPGAPQTFYSNGVNAELMGSTCNSGTQFPTSPAPLDATWFYRTDLYTLFLYNATAAVWKAVQSFGAVTLYVDGTNGTDVVGKGYASGTSATKTVQYAVDLLPPINGGNVIVNIATGTYAESVIIKGKSFSGDYTLLLTSTLSSIKTGTVGTGSVQGTGATRGTVVDGTGGMTVNAYQDMLLYFNTGVNAGTYRLIDSNTAANFIPVGTWPTGAPANGDTYTVYDWQTTISNGTNPGLTLTSQPSVETSNIILGSTSTWAAYVQEYSTLLPTRTKFTSGLIAFNYGKVDSPSSLQRSNLIKHSGTYGAYSTALGYIDLRSSKVTGPAQGVVAIAVGTAAIRFGTCINNCATVGVYASQGNANTANNTAQGYNFITNCAVGIKTDTGGTIVNHSSNQYSGNTVNASLEGLYSAAGANRTPFHMVQGTGTLVAGVLTVTLTAPATFTSTTSYTVAVTANAASTYKVTYTSGTAFTITSSNLADTHVVNWLTIGD